MNILFAFTPFLAFAVADRLMGATTGLVTGALVSVILLLHDLVIRKKEIKALEIGTLILFAALAGYSVIDRPNWSVMGVRLCVDSGLLLLVLLSIGIRWPFTMQYAREECSKDVWNTSEFVRTNYIISTVWAVAFAIMVAADLIMVYSPNVPLQVVVVTTVAALFGSVRFTTWYPDRRR